MATTVTVQPADNEQEDIFTPGKLLTCNAMTLMSLSTSTAIVLEDKSGAYKYGQILSRLDEDNCTKFTGTITIQST